MGSITKFLVRLPTFRIQNPSDRIEKERMSGHGALDYDATVEEIQGHIQSMLREVALKNGTFGDLDDKIDTLQEDLEKLDYLKKENLSRKEAILSQFPSLAAEEAEPREKRSGSDIAVAQDDDVSPTPNEGDEGDEERVTEIATLVAEIGKIMSTAILK